MQSSTKYLKLVLFLLAFSVSGKVLAQYLDKPYPYKFRPKKSTQVRVNRNNNVVQTIALQSSVKSQGSRGTCSIFSATALLESFLIRNGLRPETLDLSEEWLEFLAMQGQSDDGSYTYKNFHLLTKWGTVSEKTWPYDPSAWSESSSKTLERCAGLKATPLKACMLGHRNHKLLYTSEQTLKNTASDLYDPDFFVIRSQALDFKRKMKAHWGDLTQVYTIGHENTIKDLLDRNIAVIVDLDFYYGSWNHSKATSMGMHRDTKNWSLGIVDYPEYGSVDRTESMKNRAGHSVVIVGYNDLQTVTYQKKMKNGELKTFTRTGVYYFKNSWGTDSFGRNLVVGGKAAAGYGMITQDYAHEAGTFYVFK